MKNILPPLTFLSSTLVNEYAEVESSIHLNNQLQLSKINLNEDYRKKFNVHEIDFVCLTRNGELVNNSLYRVGGLSRNVKINECNYFMLLKYEEDMYEYDFIKKCYPNLKNKEIESRRPYLKSKYCILDKNGVEKVVFEDTFFHPHLFKNSCIYSYNRNFYNIETGELYCNSNNYIESTDYLFIKNTYDETDKSKEGVMKINKKDGKFVVFK